jgi:hypothetical protein
VLRHDADGFTVLGRPEGIAHPVDAQAAGEDVVAGLQRALASAQLDPAGLDVVVLAGWSTRIGSIAAAVADALGVPVAVDTEPEHAVALGAARLAAWSAEDGATRVVGVGATRPLAAPGLPAPPLAVPHAPRRPRSGGRGLAVVVAAAAVALGVLGGGAIALAGASAPAVAAPAPVADVSPATGGDAAPVGHAEAPVEHTETTAEPALAVADPATTSPPPAAASSTSTTSPPSAAPSARSTERPSGGSSHRPPSRGAHHEDTHREDTHREDEHRPDPDTDPGDTGHASGADTDAEPGTGPDTTGPDGAGAQAG